MVDRTDYGFPFLLTGDGEQAPMPHRQSDIAGTPSEHADVIPDDWKTDAERKLDRAKAIAAEVCARRFPVTKIPKEQQE